MTAERSWELVRPDGEALGRLTQDGADGATKIYAGEGEEVEFVTPTGKAKKYTITAITR